MESIPCLNYKRPTEFEAKKKSRAPVSNSTDALCPSMIPEAKLESVEEAEKEYSVTPAELREYCDPLFKFKEIHIKKFR